MLLWFQNLSPHSGTLKPNLWWRSWLLLSHGQDFSRLVHYRQGARSRVLFGRGKVIWKIVIETSLLETWTAGNLGRNFLCTIEKCMSQKTNKTYPWIESISMYLRCFVRYTCQLVCECLYVCVCETDTHTHTYTLFHGIFLFLYTYLSGEEQWCPGRGEWWTMKNLNPNSTTQQPDYPAPVSKCILNMGLWIQRPQSHFLH